MFHQKILFRDYCLVVVKGLVQLNEAMSHAMYSQPDGWVIVEGSDKMWSTEGGNGKPPQYTCCEHLMNCISGLLRPIQIPYSANEMHHLFPSR